MKTLGETYQEGVVSLCEGEIVRFDGGVMCLRDLIKRRWGWPKKAAVAAADFLNLLARESGSGSKPVLWVGDPYRQQQQQMLFECIPGLVEMLCVGLANGSSKESMHCETPVKSISIRFDRSIDDDGLIKEITSTIARRLGCSTIDLRSVTKYITTGSSITLDVPVSRFGHEGGEDDSSCNNCMGKNGSHFGDCKGDE